MMAAHLERQRRSEKVREGGDAHELNDGGAPLVAVLDSLLERRQAAACASAVADPAIGLILDAAGERLQSPNVSQSMGRATARPWQGAAREFKPVTRT